MASHLLGLRWPRSGEAKAFYPNRNVTTIRVDLPFFDSRTIIFRLPLSSPYRRRRAQPLLAVERERQFYLAGGFFDLIHRKWQASFRGRSSVDAIALGAARFAAAYRHQIWLRHGPMRRLHRSY
jgi:hypothetical protein